MGFCLFNNVAVAARYAQRKYAEIERVAIVDWDIHHGNGTQGIFYAVRRSTFSRRTSIRGIREREHAAKGTGFATQVHDEPAAPRRTPRRNRNAALKQR